MAIISASEAAKRLGITRARLYCYIRDGRLKATKFASVWMIDTKDLAKLKRLPRGRPPVPNPVRPRPRKGDQRK